MENETKQGYDAELMPTDNGALMALEKASIDMQIATAHQYPRSMSIFKKRAIDIATIDEDTAQSCIYRRPVGKDKSGKQEFAEGMSVRMAEIVGASYGNLRVAARILSQTERQIVAQGIAHDLESNFMASSEVVECTVDRNGRPFNERMRAVIAKAALAKARRDATFQVVPKALCKPVENAVRALLFGEDKPIAKRRAAAMEWASKLGIEVSRVFLALGVTGADDIGVEQLETLTGIKTALRDGEITIDDAFPKPATIKDEGGTIG
jgi:hypothetical protein